MSPFELFVSEFGNACHRPTLGTGVPDTVDRNGTQSFNGNAASEHEIPSSTKGAVRQPIDCVESEVRRDTKVDNSELLALELAPSANATKLCRYDGASWASCVKSPPTVRSANVRN
jgi:hypothetical protein